MSNLSPSGTSQSCWVDRLRNKIQKFETAGRVGDGTRVASGCAAIDRMLPGGGYSRGALIQWLTGGGQGANYLSLMVAMQACAEGGALVVFDPQNEFYPPAAAAIGINLDHLIILRTDNTASQKQTGCGPVLSNDLLWSIDQALRCPAVAAVWGRLGHLEERWFRRFQLSAESSGCLGLLIQPTCESRQPTWAEVQWLVSDVRRPPASQATPSLQTQEVRLQLARCRASATGKSVNLSINTITGSVQPVRRGYEQPNQHGKQHPASQQPNRQQSNLPPTLQPNPLPVVPQLGHPAAGRQRA